MSGVAGSKWGTRQSKQGVLVKQYEWNRRNPDKALAIRRRHNLKKLFGLTEADYNEMSERQGHACAICGKPETSRFLERIRRLAVDHNHDTGKVRDLLCSDCNRAIGMMQDSPELLEQAALYLRTHKEEIEPNV